MKSADRKQKLLSNGDSKLESTALLTPRLWRACSWWNGKHSKVSFLKKIFKQNLKAAFREWPEFELFLETCGLSFSDRIWVLGWRRLIVESFSFNFLDSEIFSKYLMHYRRTDYLFYVQESDTSFCKIISFEVSLVKISFWSSHLN